MYKTIKIINEKIKATANRLNINRNDYTLDDIYTMLLDNDLLNLLDGIFKNYKSINERSLDICNKFECEVIKMYLQLNEKKINEKKYIGELDHFDNNYDIYYNDIADYDFLSEEREKQLLKEYKLNNDQKSLDLLVGAYQKMIINMAKKYTSDDYLLLDLIQAGNVGLLKTINNYDINYNVRLYTFAYVNVFSHIYRTFYKYKYSDVYGCNLFELRDKVEKYINNYICENNSIPSDEEVINDLNIDYDEFLYVKFMKLNESLNEEVSVECLEEDNYSDERYMQEELLYSIKDEYNLEEEVEKKAIEKIVIDICKECLDDKEFLVIADFLKFDGYEKSPKELLNEVATCRQYVYHIKSRAIKKLKNNQKLKELVKGFTK